MMLKEPEFWVAVSFVIFAGLLIWKGVPGLVARSLDARAERIKRELEEAQKLREEAQELLASYEHRREEAEKEAEEIIIQARAEAENYATEARRKLEESLKRRSQLAEDKIAQAEAAAIKDVRATAADIAVKAATAIIAKQATGSRADKLIDQSIKLVKSQLN